MNRLLLIALTVMSLVAGPTIALAQTTGSLNVPYLWEEPKIDGAIDMVVGDLPVHTLTPDGAIPASAEKVTVEYRIGYRADFLYLYIEMTGKGIVYRDRGYQNGDGFIVSITSPYSNEEGTRDFYVLGFTPQKDSAHSWQYAFVWYHDVDLAMSRLKGAVLATAEQGEKIAFEVKIPWSEIYPYHPWLSAGIGFNLRVTRAIGDTDRASFIALTDNKIDSEQSPRKGIPLTFSAPTSGPLQVASVLWRNNFRAGLADSARVAYFGDSALTEDMTITIASNRGNVPGIRQFPLTGTGKVETMMVGLPTLMLLPNDYDISWSAGTDSGRTSFTVLPDYDLEKLKHDLRTMGTVLSPASVATMEFLLGEIEAEQGNLQPNRPAPKLGKLLRQFNDLTYNARGGIDKLAHQTGVVRRAFRSKIDNTLQPYSMQVPSILDSTKKYPLVVYLHGSGEDDQRALPTRLFSDSQFVLAPFGRGTSNCYSADHAQEDIMEALADVVANYPIDPRRVVIAGFSMGGYGAYRAFAEHPGTYCAAAIFSGHPNLAYEWSGEKSEPNYLEPARLAPFKGHKLFVFHGGKDRNCPIELTQQLVETLKGAGADVTFVFEPEAGHQMPNLETIATFQNWLAGAVKP